jgi:hypothetical protein
VLSDAPDFTGNVAFDSTTLFVDSVSSSVGVGTNEPQATLDVEGNVFVSSNLEVGTANLFVDTVTGNVGIGKTNPGVALDVVGGVQITSNLAVDTDTLFVDSVANRVGIGKTNPGVALDVVGATSISGDLAVATNKFTVASGTGNTGIAGTLDVSGNSTLGGTLGVTGNSTLGGTLAVASNLAVDTDTLFVDSVANRVGIGKTNPGVALDVVGDTNISGDVDITGNVVMQGQMFTGNAFNRVFTGRSTGSENEIGFGTVSSRENTVVKVTVVSTRTTTYTFLEYIVYYRGLSTPFIQHIVHKGGSTSGTPVVFRTDPFDGGQIRFGYSGVRSDSTAWRVEIFERRGNPFFSVTNTGSAMDTTGLIEVTGTGATNFPGTLSVASNLAVDTNTLFVDSVGNRVGIGITNPGSTLHINSTDSIIVPVGTEAQRPVSAVGGMIRYNSDIGGIEYYDAISGAWFVLMSTDTPPGNGVLATGGTITESGGIRTHTFTDTGGSAFTVLRGGNVEYLVVAGGGGGGGCDDGSAGGGGGGGGMLTGPALTVTNARTYTIIVGPGGTSGTNSSGSIGGNSRFSEIESTGGGGGGRGQTASVGGIGGSGGGGGSGRSGGTFFLNNNGGSGIVGQGSNGGSGGGGNTPITERAGGGGGGKGEVGQNASSSQAGNGGNGVEFHGTTYGGGGGGGRISNNSTGTGGTGGGGNGGNFGSSDGLPNTGGGGGGTGNTSSRIGGTGGSGIVIIRYTITT